MESPELVRVTAIGRLAYGGGLRVIVTGNRPVDGSTRFSSGPLSAPSPNAAQPRVRMEARLEDSIVNGAALGRHVGLDYINKKDYLQR